MRPLGEVQAEVLDAMALLPVVEVPLSHALGLVLAEPVTAVHDVPPFANSAMDGYAVRAEDVVDPPLTLRVVEDVPAGSVPTVEVTAGTAIRIMTGAPMPQGADAVVKVEDTEPGNGAVRVLAGTARGTAVRPAGGDMPSGSMVLEPGTRLGPAHLGLLAAVGAAFPKVRRRPTVAVLSTGDELVTPETQVLSPGKIRDSNRLTLCALLEELGASVDDHGIVGDDAATLDRVLDQAARAADAVVTSGGVSMGEYDLVKQELRKLGTVDFWQVAMQPAKPFAFGSLLGTPLFGLPGNPVSVFVAFEQFVRPALLTMMGARRVFRPRVMAIAAEELTTDPDKTVFVRVTTSPGESGLLARRSGGQGSNVLSALAAADAFAVVPVGVGIVAEGAEVELELFRSPESRTREVAIGG